jgi:hypothetical protein
MQYWSPAHWVLSPHSSSAIIGGVGLALASGTGWLALLVGPAAAPATDLLPRGELELLHACAAKNNESMTTIAVPGVLVR